jgi:two-component system, chemotaxis family, CheB/CheR fusion protein
MEDSESSFPVVGIGASAGGLEAVTELISGIKTESGLAFLLVQHLDPRHPSLLAEIIATKTGMKVETAVDGESIKADSFYVIPPNTTMTVESGTLRLAARPPERGCISRSMSCLNRWRANTRIGRSA